jgi:hypothetical protein
MLFKRHRMVQDRRDADPYRLITMPPIARCGSGRNQQ